jgi:acid phosphatase
MLKRWHVGLVGLLAGWASAPILWSGAPAQGPGDGPQAMPAFKKESPANRGLDASLYMQTAAEYRACCYQAYNLASARLEVLAKEHNAKEGGKKRPAVVLDLDETVFDNAGYQAMLLRSGLASDDRLWDLWETDHTGSVGLIPGAKAFIDKAKELGVAVVYISNRGDKHRDKTREVLKRLEIDVPEDCVKLLKDEKNSDKTGRRDEVRQAYKVLLFLGDNLRDFDEQFKYRAPQPGGAVANSIKERKDDVDKTRDRWGSVWIILPNPAYGEWTKPFSQSAKDLDWLVAPPRK